VCCVVYSSLFISQLEPTGAVASVPRQMHRCSGATTANTLRRGNMGVHESVMCASLPRSTRLPSRKWLEPCERTALVQACAEFDPGRLGRIPVAALGKVLAAVGSEVTFSLLAYRSVGLTALSRFVESAFRLCSIFETPLLSRVATTKCSERLVSSPTQSSGTHRSRQNSRHH